MVTYWIEKKTRYFFSHFHISYLKRGIFCCCCWKWYSSFVFLSVLIYAGICYHQEKSWLGILFSLHEPCNIFAPAVHSELTNQAELKLNFFRLLIAHAQLATLSTLTHAWLRQKYFLWKDEKNVPTIKCTYLLTKLSQRWGEMSFPVCPNQIIFFIFPFFFNFLSLAVQPPLHEKAFFVSV